jgi:hypothetical protein
MMRQIFMYVFCTAGMTGFWYICRELVVDTPESFSNGLVVGVGMTIFLIWLAEKVSPSHRD